MVHHQTEPQREDKEKNGTIKSVLTLTLEMIYQLTGEEYTIVKKTFGERLFRRDCSSVLGGWNRTQGPMIELPHCSLIPEGYNDQKILDLTNKIIELLTGEVPIRCQDGTVHFSMEEWEYIEGHKDLYKEVIEDHQPLTSMADDCSKGLKKNLSSLPTCDIEVNNITEDFNQSRLIHHQRSHTEENTLSSSKTEQTFTEKHGLVGNKRTRSGKTFSCLEGGDCRSTKSKLVQNLHLEEKQFTCPDCEKCFSNEPDLVKHKKGHTGCKPFSCLVCWESFSVKLDFVDHQKSHSKEKQFSCVECGKAFAQKASLLSHIKIHIGEMFQCKQCKKCFSQKAGLITHQRTHTGEKPYSCPECGKNFAQQAGLSAHVRTHTGEKPYLCFTCWKGFAQKAGLIAHERTHTGEKPYSCSKCGKRFAQKAGLIAHQKIHQHE
ncbi:gastrula zinc finger protein XlCGF66.1-like isoform 1-T3 [Anomaloglossus baeobatrachus]